MAILLIFACSFFDEASPAEVLDVNDKNPLLPPIAGTNLGMSHSANVGDSMKPALAPAAVQQLLAAVAATPVNTTDDANLTKKAPLIDEEATQAEEKKDSLAIFFILLIIVLAIRSFN